jgi:hypothetical protein
MLGFTGLSGKQVALALPFRAGQTDVDGRARDTNVVAQRHASGWSNKNTSVPPCRTSNTCAFLFRIMAHNLNQALIVRMCIMAHNLNSGERSQLPAGIQPSSETKKGSLKSKMSMEGLFQQRWAIEFGRAFHLKVPREPRLK